MLRLQPAEAAVRCICKIPLYANSHIADFVAVPGAD